MVGNLLSKVSEFQFNEIGDNRGTLISLESGMSVPFDIKRVYYMYNTTLGTERGFHAHINLQQMAVCTSGSCQIDVEYVNGKNSYVLDSPDKGLYIGGLVWREMRNFSNDCVLMVLADALYTEGDYLRNYTEFKKHLDILTSSIIHQVQP